MDIAGLNQLSNMLSLQGFGGREIVDGKEEKVFFLLCYLIALFREKIYM